MLEYFLGVLTSITASIIYLLFQLLIRKLGRKKYNYLLGTWHGYYLIKKGELILEQKVEIKYDLFKNLNIYLEEISTSKYSYSGKLKMIEDRLYGILDGVYHPAKSFIIMILPLNRRELPSINGIFAGITQDKNPAAIKIHLSRSPKNRDDLKNEFGDGVSYIISKNDTKENALIKDIDETLKS
jgi:hypothetical protein